MGEIHKIKKLIRKTAKIESNLPPIGKIRLAKKRLYRMAGLDADEIKTKVLENKAKERKEAVITKFELMNDIKSKAEEDPKNKTLQTELDSKKMDLEYAVEDLARAEKEKSGDDPLADEVPRVGRLRKAEKDKTNISDENMDDKAIEKIIKDFDDDERHVFEALAQKVGSKKKLLKIAKEFNEDDHPRDGGKFTSKGGGDSDDSEDDDKKSDKDSKKSTKGKVGPTPAEAGTDAVLKDSGFAGTNSKTLDSIQEALGVDDVQIKDVSEDMGIGNGTLIEMDDGSEFLKFDNEADAREAAKESLERLFDDIGIEGWSEGFREQFITVDNVAAREIALEEGESLRESLEDDDLSEDEIEAKIEEHVDEVEESIKSDPRNYFVEEQGLMSDEDFNKADFVSIDTDGLFEASIDEDGIGHTLAGYDGEEIVTDDNQFIYRTN